MDEETGFVGRCGRFLLHRSVFGLALVFAAGIAAILWQAVELESRLLSDAGHAGASPVENHIAVLTVLMFTAGGVGAVGLVLAVWSSRRTANELERRVNARTAELVAVNADLAGQMRARQRMERELRESEERHRLVVDRALDAVVTADATGTITAWNAQAEQIFGWTSHEAVGRPLSDTIVPWHQRKGHEKGMAQFVATGRGELVNRRIEVTAVRRDEGEFPVELSICPVKTGDTYVFNAFVRDITERRRAEEALRKAKDEAEAATVAKSQFLANMSHEIRTPMNAVIGMTGLLLDTDLDDEQRDFVETIQTGGDTLLTLINDILDFSKIESGMMELERHAFDLRDCVEDSLDLLAPKAAAKGLDLAYLIEGAVPSTLLGDVTRVRQVLVNLLSNAIKFTETGEVVVRVDAERVPDDRRPEHAGDNPVFEVHFSVTDTGIGIPADQVDRMFDSFTQADASTTRRYGGTGLGLAISRRLADLMSGTMWVDSVVGEGSTFHFTIEAESTPAQPRRFLRATQPELRLTRLLIVDDNATNRRILEHQADKWGMVPRSTASGAEALSWLDAGDEFDIAIVDVHMPGMDGVELSRRIRERKSRDELPVVVLSSVGRREEELRTLGAHAVLTKPLKPSQLHDALIGIVATRPVRAPEPSQKAAPAAAEPLHPLRILVAEDNVVNQKVAVKMLARLGYHADVAANGRDVLQALDRLSYDLVLMDVQMPELDGIEATRLICERWDPDQRPRLVAMTANAMEGDRDECLAAGMDDYVAKPIRMGELHAVLVRCLTAMGRGAEAQQPARPESGRRG